MANCKFEFPLEETIETAKEKIISGIEKNNGEINFSGNEGSFVIKHPMATIGGKILLSENQLEIEITDKPAFLPCEMIKSEVGKFFAN